MNALVAVGKSDPLLVGAGLLKNVITVIVPGATQKQDTDEIGYFLKMRLTCLPVPNAYFMFRPSTAYPGAL
jgi:hypothetical protein